MHQIAGFAPAGREALVRRALEPSLPMDAVGRETGEPHRLHWRPLRESVGGGEYHLIRGADHEPGSLGRHRPGPPAQYECRAPDHPRLDEVLRERLTVGALGYSRRHAACACIHTR